MFIYGGGFPRGFYFCETKERRGERVNQPIYIFDPEFNFMPSIVNYDRLERTRRADDPRDLRADLITSSDCCVTGK